MIVADLADDGTPARVAERVEHAHGRLDLLVNNAGVGGRGSFGSSGWAEVRRTMAVNFDAPVRLTEALRALIDWALAQPDVRRVEADTAHGNLASRRVMERAGMRLIGRSEQLRFYRYP